MISGRQGLSAMGSKAGGMVKGSVLERCRRAAVEFLAWSDHHAQEATARRVARGQIETHPDLNPMGNALEQQKAWARRHGREHRLQVSALSQLRSDCGPRESSNDR